MQVTAAGKRRRRASGAVTTSTHTTVTHTG